MKLVLSQVDFMHVDALLLDFLGFHFWAGNLPLWSNCWQCLLYMNLKWPKVSPTSYVWVLTKGWVAWPRLEFTLCISNIHVDLLKKKKSIRSKFFFSSFFFFFFLIKLHFRLSLTPEKLRENMGGKYRGNIEGKKKWNKMKDRFQN